jgi:hypothetical protein
MLSGIEEQEDVWNETNPSDERRLMVLPASVWGFEQDRHLTKEQDIPRGSVVGYK